MLKSEFTLVTRAGKTAWLHRPTGRILPYVAGGAGDGDGGEGGDGGAGEGGQGGGDGGGGDGDKSFSQADVDRIVKERLARAKTTPPPDYDDLKAKAAKFDELEEKNKDELTKANDRATAAETRATQAEERAQLLSKRTAVVAAAVRAGAVDPDAVFALIDNDAVTIGDDGQVKGADDAVKSLLEAKPYLVGQAGGKNAGGKSGSADGGARGNGDGKKQLSRDDLASMSPKQIEQARRDGQLNDLLTGKT